MNDSLPYLYDVELHRDYRDADVTQNQKIYVEEVDINISKYITY